MALKISANSLTMNHYLVVRSDGVKYVERAFVGGTRWFRFSEIDCILLSPDHKLSIQVGWEVFSIPTKPDDAKHQKVIATLVQEVERAQGVGNLGG